MKQYDVYGIGNALVDTEYEVTDDFLSLAMLPKGVMTLIEESDRLRLIRLLEEEHEHQAIKQAGGGSAANTMVAISQLGGSAFYSCKVANDETGDFFMSDLETLGIRTNLDDNRESGVTGACISMVTPDAERTMTTHLGITQTLSPTELVPDALRASSVLYIEGYLVSSPSGFEAALQAQAIAKEAGVQVALTLSDPAMVENFNSAFDTLLRNGVDILFCNDDEAKLWSSQQSRQGAMSAILDACPRFAMTCGREGAYVHDGNATTHVEAVPTQPVDTTGAGDNFAGSFLYKVCHGSSYPEAATFANKSASLLVSSFGARLTMETVEQHLQVQS